MIYLLYTLHVIICLFLILVVLLQQGKGADLSVFGGGSTMAAFGARSATNLLHRMTVGAFVAFMLTTLGIAYLKGNVEGGSVMTTPITSGGDTNAAPGVEPAPADNGGNTTPAPGVEPAPLTPAEPTPPPAAAPASDNSTPPN